LPWSSPSAGPSSTRSVTFSPINHCNDQQFLLVFVPACKRFVSTSLDKASVVWLSFLRLLDAASLVALLFKRLVRVPRRSRGRHAVSFKDQGTTCLRRR
jgi:hypothetical protein